MKNLRNLRKRAGLTQAGLAARTEISRYRLVYAEGGYELSPEEEGKIVTVIDKAIRENTESIRRVIADRSEAVAAS